ncbi:hypothetical protein HYW20_06030 [Candidatus Woesearchaeota archaeon]|nr:hypothetical protein [Candidatus Woesearchaeota archaeon]
MFDHFAKEKSDFLRKKDKSRKGRIDKGIIKIISTLNSKNDYYTTSSCAGRIVLLEIKSRKKDECRWIFIKHDEVTFNEINNSLKKYNNNIKNNKTNKKIENQIWLKQQPVILHVACRNLDAARKLLDASRKIFKHSGMIGVTDKKATIEIIGNERIETVIADNNFAADEKYFKNLIKYANKNFVENKSKIGKFFSLIKGL